MLNVASFKNYFYYSQRLKVEFKLISHAKTAGGVKRRYTHACLSIAILKYRGAILIR